MVLIEISDRTVMKIVGEFCDEADTTEKVEALARLVLNKLSLFDSADFTSLERIIKRAKARAAESEE